MMNDSVSRLEELLDKVRVNREVLRRQRQQQSSQGIISLLNKKIAGDESQDQLSSTISSVIPFYEQRHIQEKVSKDIADDIVDPFAKEADSFVPAADSFVPKSQEPVLPVSSSPVESFIPEVEETQIQGASLIPTVESSALESFVPEVEEFQLKDEFSSMSAQEVDIPDSEDNYSPEGFVLASDIQEATSLETTKEMETLETEASAAKILEKKVFDKGARVSGPIVKVIEKEIERNWTIRAVLDRAWLVGNME
jgi:hypothetical protein